MWKNNKDNTFAPENSVAYSAHLECPYSASLLL